MLTVELCIRVRLGWVQKDFHVHWDYEHGNGWDVWMRIQRAQAVDTNAEVPLL